jgi:hypothetical protein
MIQKPKTRLTSIGLFTFLRTYSRRQDENDPKSRIETWEQTITRVVRSGNEQLNIGFTKEEQEEVYNLLVNLKFSVAGRFLWQLGTRTVDRMGLMSLQNCCATVINDPVKPFTWAMNFLMLGAGIGVRLLPEDLSLFPIVKRVNATRHDTNDALFIVPDSREGWVALISKLLKAHFYSGRDFTYSCLLLRSKGAPIKSFGGTASGPEILCEGITKINEILNNRTGQNLRPIDALDIINIIGMIVVAGNVRRCIAKGSLVHLRSGLVPIENVKVGDEALTFDGYHRVSNTFIQGIQDLVNINTENGCFACTPNHRMPVLNGMGGYSWKEARELTTDDTLITCGVSLEGNPDCKLPAFYNYKLPEVDDVMSWFIGTITKSPSIESNHHDSRKDSYDQLQKLIYAIDPSVNIDCYINNRGYKVKYVSDKVSEFIGMVGHNIPDFIFEAPHLYRIAYLRGIAETHGENRGYMISYQSTSDLNVVTTREKVFAECLRGLLYSCGIQNKFTFINGIYSIDLTTETSKYILFNVINKTDTYYPEKVVSVTSGVCDETFDIEVENVHEFYCNGYLTHNSAILCLGDCNDKEYLMAKRWDLGNIPNTRCYSNNSVVCNDIEDVLSNEEFWEGYKGNGEPYGLINLKLMRECGRIGDLRYPDPTVECINPCSEICLSDKETCCLADIFLPNIETKEELFICAQYAYRFCKQSLTLPCPASKETEDIIKVNRRIGLGITGYLQATEEQKKWLPECYEMIRQYDVEYSSARNIPVSVKISTCKPSGTLSIIGNTTPGIHPGYSKYYIRRIRISSDNSLVEVAHKHGHQIEYSRKFDGTNDYTTKIVSFPCKFPKGTILAKDCTAIQQLEYAKRMQTDWSDNSVSVTVYYRLEELDEIKQWLRINYNNSVKSVSFLLHNNHGFDQAPLEEITKEKYKELSAICIPITDTSNICYNEEENLESLECAGGMCPIR